MSDASVNDHLEGILSDFEALKRSFDIEDETPACSPSKPPSSPFSPASNSKKTNDGRGAENHTPPPYQSRISINPSPAQSPVLRNKVATSLSFNRGTTKTSIRANGKTGSGINRASSFQSRFNPNGFSSSSGLGIRNESLRSSSSSLDSSQASLSRHSHHDPASSSGLPLGSTGRREFKTTGLVGPALKKFSSHGNVFHSEAEASSGPTYESAAVIHGSMPSLDLQGTGSRGVACLVDRFSQTGKAWNTSAGRQLGGASSPRHLTPKPKEVAKLNKFPLDLENLVTKPKVPSTETPSAPKPLPRCHLKPPTAPSPVSAAPSMPLVDDSSDANQGLPSENSETVEPAQAPGPFHEPAVIALPISFSSAQAPELPLITQPQMVEVIPSGPQPPKSPNSSQETCQELPDIGSNMLESSDKEEPQVTERLVFQENEVPHTIEIEGSPNKAPQDNDSIVLPDNEVPQATESVQSPDKELQRANDCTDKEGSQANESADLPDKEDPPGKENIEPPDEELLRSNESTGSPEKEIPAANENTVLPCQEVPQISENIGSILQRITSFSQADGTGPPQNEDNHLSNKGAKEGPEFLLEEEKKE
ncbi:hypothetical protein GJAV_G00219680, partial [Gymnothorax javanicus]